MSETIGSALARSMTKIRSGWFARRKTIKWMRGNNFWYRELIAQEWERQTGEPWLDILADCEK